MVWNDISLKSVILSHCLHVSCAQIAPHNKSTTTDRFYLGSSLCAVPVKWVLPWSCEKRKSTTNPANLRLWRCRNHRTMKDFCVYNTSREVHGSLDVTRYKFMENKSFLYTCRSCSYTDRVGGKIFLKAALWDSEPWDKNSWSHQFIRKKSKKTKNKDERTALCSPQSSWPFHLSHMSFFSPTVTVGWCRRTAMQKNSLHLVWKRHACLTKPEFIRVILPHISAARLEQPMEKIPVYFQKQIKAFRLWSADLSSKWLEKSIQHHCCWPSWPLQVMNFSNPGSPSSGMLPLHSSPLPELLMHLTSATCHCTVIIVYSARVEGGRCLVKQLGCRGCILIALYPTLPPKGDIQYVGFPGGLPPHYWLDWDLLCFRDSLGFHTFSGPFRSF